MKVAIFTRYATELGRPRGGVEVCTGILARALARFDDLDIHVITLEPGRPQVAIDYDESVTVHRLPGSRWPQIIDILVGPGRRYLLQYIKDNLQPDILHTHETYGLALGTISVPHVFTVHGFDHANLVAESARFCWARSKLWALVQRRGFAKQRHIISITPYVRKMLEPLTSAMIHDINIPVSEHFFKIEPRPEPGRILCVGWIDERKNTLMAIQALARLVHRNPEAKLVLVGDSRDSEYRDRLQAFVSKHRLEANVEFFGYADHTQLADQLSRASVLVLPSRQENSPAAVAEAMAAGVPVVAANRCGMPYMIDEGKTGFLVDPESTEQISQRLAQLVGSQQLCQQMGQAGREKAMEHFHPHAVALRTRAVYEQICAST